MKDLAVIDPNETEWDKLVTEIFDSVEIPDLLPRNVTKATELLLAGLPVSEVAERINIAPATVRSWLSKYPQMGVILARGEEALAEWRRAKLAAQLVDALEVSEDVLNVSIYDPEINSKVLAVKAQHARFVMGLFFGTKRDVNVQHSMSEDGVFNASKEALDYLVDKMKEAALDEVPARYEIVDGIVTDIPVDEDGNLLFGEYGELVIDDDGKVMCHSCGEYFHPKGFYRHTASAHGLDKREYKLVFGVEVDHE